MSVSYAEVRLRRTAILALILVAGWLAIPDTLERFWSRFQSFASDFVQFDTGRYQAIEVMTIMLGVGGWILVGLLKEG